MPIDNCSVDEKRRDIKILRAIINYANNEISRLKREVENNLYLDCYYKMISQPIKWESLLWPSKGNIRLRPIYRCIVCHQPIGRRQHWDGFSSENGSPFFVHEHCVPEKIKEKERGFLD